MNLGFLLKTKLLIALLAGAALLGGGTAVVAATPAGHQALQVLTGAAQAPTTPAATTPHDTSGGPPCPGLAEAQRLATQFSLSPASASDALQAICALHTGTFTGTPPGGDQVASTRVWGYGEIEQWLTYAHYLASQDQANQAGALTTANARSYLAAALQRCGPTPLAACVKAQLPGYQPGTGPGTGNGSGNGNKPSSTPTPPGNTGNKPTSTPTPHH